jgi:hypothetical protein
LKPHRHAGRRMYDNILMACAPVAGEIDHVEGRS